MPIITNERFWPVVLHTFEGNLSESEFDCYIDRLDAILGRKRSYVTVVDTTPVGLTSRLQRSKQADWIKRNTENLKNTSLGTAFVIASPVVRALLSAMLWIQPLPHPYVVTETLADALLWSCRQLQTAGVQIPLGLLQSEIQPVGGK